MELFRLTTVSEFACGNIVRRVLGIVRESAQGGEQDNGSSMFELLSSTSQSSAAQSGAPGKATKVSRDAKADIIEGIQELIEEITNIEETVSSLSVDMIHEK